MTRGLKMPKQRYHLIRYRLLLLFIFLPFLYSFLSIDPLVTPGGKKKSSPLPGKDTLYIRKGPLILTKDLIICIQKDTFLTGTFELSRKRDTSFHMKSKTFYDSVYRKFSRNKITRFLYDLAFIAPQNSSLPDSVQVIKSTDPFVPYKSKIIRSIRIKVLHPFGESLFDTTMAPLTGAGKWLNKVHMNSRSAVIKKNLLIKEGEPVDPELLGDNERVLRDLPYIDDARILVEQADSSTDSVDLVVITKDVWSIGLDIPSITTQKIAVRLYDANFLGLGDRLTVNTSAELKRAPFFRLDGVSYSFSNIGGSQINAYLEYYANNEGDRSYEVSAEKPFLTNRTKWAGGIGAAWWKDVSEPDTGQAITSRYNEEQFWVGRSFHLSSPKSSRMVIAIATYRKQFSMRPEVTIDSNRSYYNTFKVLGSLSWSNNKYYVTDYVTSFGKTENLPYGHLIQFTAGYDQTDYYERIYSGFSVSAGKYFDHAGYFSGYAGLSGYWHKSSFEDAILKVYTKYFTPLYRSHNGKFKFRTYLITNYRYAFNLRPNFRDYYDINLDFRINKINEEEALEGIHTLSVNLTEICFPPWFFYGFRFGLMANLQAGLVAPQGADIITQPLISGIGAGLLIKNDNLVFPTFMIAGYFYPNSGAFLNPFQVYLTSDLRIRFPDFNVTAPHEESLNN